MAKGERTSQKQRTRQDLLQAASRLMAQGQLPKVADVAKEALVSRATAYRFFSSDEELIAEAAIDVRTPTARQLFEGDTSLDTEERLLKANAVMHDVVWKNQKQMRFMWRVCLTRATARARCLARTAGRTSFTQHLHPHAIGLMQRRIASCAPRLRW